VMLQVAGGSPCKDMGCRRKYAEPPLMSHAGH